MLQTSAPTQQDQPSAAYSPSILLDFGKVVTAIPEIRIDAPAGCEIRLGYAEQLIDGEFNNAIECPFADSYVAREGSQVWQTSHWRAFRYLKLQLFAYREPARVTLRSLRAWRTSYPFDYSGSFESSDPQLNQLFQICRETVHLCSHEGIMDTPFREGAQWLGDVAAVTLPAIYACFGDHRLPEKFLVQSAATQRPTGFLANISNAASEDYSWDIPDYSLWWVRGVWVHYLHSGDEALLRLLYPTVVKVIQSHLSWMNEDGLIENPPCWVFIDWADINRTGISSGYNALFHIATTCAAEIAKALGDTSMATLSTAIAHPRESKQTSRAPSTTQRLASTTTASKTAHARNASASSVTPSLF